MADFAASDLVTLAKARYGEAVLRSNMRGAGGDSTLADAELLEISYSVMERVRNVAQVSVGWPLPGTNPDTGIPYKEAWPANVLQHSLELFRWRTLSTMENISADQRKIGEAAEKFFDGLEEGVDAWGIGGSSDAAPSQPLMARARDGSAIMGGITDRRNLLDELQGGGWDWV